MLYLVFAAACCSAFLISVSPNVLAFPQKASEPKPAATPQLTLGAGSVIFGHDSGNGTVVLSATAPWNASASDTWLHLLQSDGPASQLFAFTFGC